MAPAGQESGGTGTGNGTLSKVAFVMMVTVTTVPTLATPAGAFVVNLAVAAVPVAHIAVAAATNNGVLIFTPVGGDLFSVTAVVILIFAGIPSLISQDNRARRWRFLEDNPLLRRFLADDNRGRWWVGSGIVFGFFAISVDLAAVGIVAVLFDAARYNHFAIRLAVDPLLNSYFGLAISVLPSALRAAVPVSEGKRVFSR